MTSSFDSIVQTVQRQLTLTQTLVTQQDLGGAIQEMEALETLLTHAQMDPSKDDYPDPSIRQRQLKPFLDQLSDLIVSTNLLRLQLGSRLMESTKQTKGLQGYVLALTDPALSQSWRG